MKGVYKDMINNRLIKPKLLNSESIVDNLVTDEDLETTYNTIEKNSDKLSKEQKTLLQENLINFLNRKQRKIIRFTSPSDTFPEANSKLESYKARRLSRFFLNYANTEMTNFIWKIFKNILVKSKIVANSIYLNKEAKIFAFKSISQLKTSFFIR